MGTYAPQQLLELRRYLRPLTGLPDNALGIVGDASHNGGYHHGWSMRRIVNGITADYSWTESGRDMANKSDAASAFDIGAFPGLRELSLWLARECESGAPDTLDIRSVIYSPDGVTVKRWDRLGRRTSGDPSHLTHTHVSYFRDAEGRSKIGPYKRFFEGKGAMTEFSQPDPWGPDPDGHNRTPAQKLRDMYAAVYFGTRPVNDKGEPVGVLPWVVTRLDALGEVNPVALAQALVAQPDFVDTLGDAVARKLIDRLQGSVSGADQP